MKDRYIDDDGFLEEIDWQGKPAIKDALWRTAILNIITGGKYPTDKCYLLGYVFRHPHFLRDYLWTENDCSRDQVIMDQVSRKITHQELPRVRIKFSDKFIQTPDMWLWMRAIRGCRVCGWLFNIWNRISLPVYFKYNDWLWKNRRGRYFDDGIRGRYPFYSFHLMSWMTYVLPETKMKRKVNLLCLKIIIQQDPTNDLLWFLHGGEDFSLDPNEYLPKTDFRWQRKLDRLPPGIALDPYFGPFPIDKDILCWAAGIGMPGCQEG